jgi:hypothetical protein
MLLTQCLPSSEARSKVLALAAEEGVPAHELGSCVIFAQPKNWVDLTRVMRVLNNARLSPPAQA